MASTDRAFVTAVMTALDKVGAKAPAAVTESWQLTQRISEQVREMGTRPDTVYAAIAAALEREEDPALDPEVQRILVASQLTNQGMMDGVDAVAYGRLREVCAEHADGIVAAFAKPFDQAAKALTDAHQMFGNIDITDAAAVLRKGGDAAARWAAATTAGTTIDTITQGWTMLGMFAGRIGNEQRYKALRLVAPTYKEWQTLKLNDRRDFTPWEAVTAGLALSLPTHKQYRERITTIVEGAQQAAEAPIDTGRSHIAGREIRIGG